MSELQSAKKTVRQHLMEAGLIFLLGVPAADHVLFQQWSKQLVKGLDLVDKTTVQEGMEAAEENSVQVAQLNPMQSTVVSLFMYMLGNTDFSLIQAPEGEDDESENSDTGI